jgi:uncharacterized protein YneF (UPF0154 family)
MIFIIDETVLLVSKHFSVWWLQLAVVISIIIGLFLAHICGKEIKKDIKNHDRV